VIIFDLETTGLPKAEGTDLALQPKIIEFGAIKLDDDLKEIDRLQFLCNPKESLIEKVVKITNITDDMLKNEKPFIAYYKDLCNFFLGEREIVAHNLPFDRKILRFELERIDKLTQFPWPPIHICTVEVGEKVWGRKVSLGEAYEKVTREKIKDAHRSLGDVEATLKLVEWYKTWKWLD